MSLLVAVCVCVCVCVCDRAGQDVSRGPDLVCHVQVCTRARLRCVLHSTVLRVLLAQLGAALLGVVASLPYTASCMCHLYVCIGMYVRMYDACMTYNVHVCMHACMCVCV